MIEHGNQKKCAPKTCCCKCHVCFKRDEKMTTSSLFMISAGKLYPVSPWQRVATSKQWSTELRLRVMGIEEKRVKLCGGNFGSNKEVTFNCKFWFFQKQPRKVFSTFFVGGYHLNSRTSCLQKLNPLCCHQVTRAHVMQVVRRIIAAPKDEVYTNYYWGF